MRTGLFVVAISAVLSTLAPRDASACSGTTPDACVPWEWAQRAKMPLAWGGLLAVPSLTTNVGVLAHLAGGRGVPLLWSITGTALWSVHATLAAAGFGVYVWAGDSDSGFPTFSGIYLGVSLVSLGVSIWGLLDRPHAAAATPARHTVAAALMPTLVGGAPGLAVLGAF